MIMCVQPAAPISPPADAQAPSAVTLKTAGRPLTFLPTCWFRQIHQILAFSNQDIRVIEFCFVVINVLLHLCRMSVGTVVQSGSSPLQYQVPGTQSH